MENADRLAAIARRRREKLRSCLLQRFGVASLLAIDRALLQTDALFLSLQGDFSAVLRELERIVTTSLPPATSNPAQEAPSWPLLVRHQSQLERLQAIQEQLSERKKLEQYRTELDSFTQRQRALRVQADTAARLEEKARAAQLSALEQASRSLEQQSVSESQLEWKLRAQESLQLNSLSRDLQRRREMVDKQTISMRYRLDEERIRQEIEAQSKAQYQKRAEIDTFNRLQADLKLKERAKEAQLSRVYSGIALPNHTDFYEDRRKQFLHEFEVYSEKLASYGQLPKSASVEDMMKQDERRALEHAQARDRAFYLQQEAEKTRKMENMLELNKGLADQIEARRRVKRLSELRDRSYAEGVHRSVARVSELERFQQMRVQEIKRKYQQELLAQMQAKKMTQRQRDCLTPEELRLNQALVEAARNESYEVSSQSPVRRIRRRQALTPSPQVTCSPYTNCINRSDVVNSSHRLDPCDSN